MREGSGAATERRGARGGARDEREEAPVAGHSKWANIKHRKEKQDRRRGKVWSKCSRAIIAAARAGGGDPATNLALRYAIDEAKYANMPKDTIQRAVEKGAGGGGGENYETVTYEGYGPGGVAVLVDALTDNRARTAPDLRMIFSKHGGNLGTTGSVAFQFETRGRVVVDAALADEERIMQIALDAEADDVQPPEPDDDGPGFWTLLVEPAGLPRLKDALEQAGIGPAEAEIARIAQQTTEVRGEDAKRLLALIDALEDNDDVQKVYTNAEVVE